MKVFLTTLIILTLIVIIGFACLCCFIKFPFPDYDDHLIEDNDQ